MRAEILNRTGYGFQLSTIFIAVITWILKEPRAASTWHTWLEVAVFAALFGIACFVNVRDLTRAAHRVKELEREINSRAGEHLLVWETLSGVLTRMGLIRSFFSRVKTLQRSQLPPLDSTYLENDSKRRRSDLPSN